MDYKFKDIMELYGTQRNFANDFGLAEETVSRWNGVIPDRYQTRLYRKMQADKNMRARYKQMLKTNKILEQDND